MKEEKFIADVHLGKLARYLRLLGFDTWYKNSAGTSELITIAKGEERILLSKNVLFAKDKSFRSCIIQSEDTVTQLKQVINEFELKENFIPFSRCMVCNNLLRKIDREKIREKLEGNTIHYYNKFWLCTGCNRIYWKGAHYKRMVELIEKLKNED